jgi:3-hydroxyisobutyrate dehydrogenase-like beta-hydroxyacid dehydrogenase
MQLGMIGLGSMGADMARRLMRDMSAARLLRRTDGR